MAQKSGIVASYVYQFSFLDQLNEMVPYVVEPYSFINFVFAYYSSFRSLVIQTVNQSSSDNSKPGLIGQTKYALEEGINHSN